MKFIFPTDKFVPTEKPHWFEAFTLTVYAKNVNEAFELIKDQIPEGHKIVFWYAAPWESCTFCGGPFHPATGDWVSEKRHWCGPCTHDMIRFLKEHTKRHWGGVRFYDHAFVPTGDTTEADLNYNKGITNE